MSQIDPTDEEILAIAREGFLDEAREMLRQFEESLLALDDDPGDLETLNSAFRAAHTIKGAVSHFGAQDAYEAAHQLEQMGKGGQLQGANAACAALERGLQRLQSALRAIWEQ